MAIYRMKLDKEPFEKIENGQKIIETRLYDEKRQRLNIGDRIEFILGDDPSKTVLTKVKALYRYDLFSNLFFDFPLECFGGVSKEGLVTEIRRFYSAEEEQKYGVIGIKIGLLEQKEPADKNRRAR